METRIREENERAAKVSLKSMEEANELLRRLKDKIPIDPTKSLSAYDNLSLSGRHIVWEGRH